MSGNGTEEKRKQQHEQEQQKQHKQHKQQKHEQKQKGKGQAPDENRVIRDKKAKVAALREAGINPYANDFQMDPADMKGALSVPVEEIPGEADIKEDDRVYRVAGRVMAAARFGKAGFFRVRYGGDELQLYVRKDNIPPDQFKAFKKCEVGDHVGGAGRLFMTRKGKPAVRLHEFRLLTKAVRPLPEKFHGLRDPELRYRMRYVDLVMNPDAADVFRTRARLVGYIRRFLDERGFVEVETPMMHPLIGGAAARPFITRHNALDMKLYMRIAPELYLKRLIVGGLERVYELGRCFRNEGLSRRHNPEFTMLEFYMSYATYVELMELTEEMLSGAVREINGSYRLTCPDGGGEGAESEVEVDFTPPWPRVAVCDATVRGLRAAGFDDAPDESEIRDDETLVEWIEKTGLAEGDGPLAQALARADSWGSRIGALFEELGEDNLPTGKPVFVVDYPAAVSPLSRRKDDDPTLVDRFEVFVCGQEIGNAFSELNDPEDQRERFVRQVEKKRSGDEETMDYDEDYCRALEFGMPPTAGEGIGIDRLAMILCGQRSIRDVIPFPLLRPEDTGSGKSRGSK
jgi:lysyl-tRNA synthetase class 2